jgi:hypothetical protein
MTFIKIYDEYGKCILVNPDYIISITENKQELASMNLSVSTRTDMFNRIDTLHTMEELETVIGFGSDGSRLLIPECVDKNPY